MNDADRHTISQVKSALPRYAPPRPTHASGRAAYVASTLKACVDGYCRQPEMAALANGLHLTLGRLGACPTYEHVPGLANIADIPSRTPFRALGQTVILDPAFMNDADRHTISQVKPVFREARLPSTATLRAASSDPSIWYAPATITTTTGNE